LRQTHTTPRAPSGKRASTSSGTFAIDKNVSHDEFAKSKIAATNAELVGERDTVKELLG
jgi:malate dehydrogenase